LPHEDIVYLGDTARVPYGTRGESTIKLFTEENTLFLLSKKVKLIIVACNTSSAVAGDYLKRNFGDVAIFEVIEPASKEAVKKGKKIGVIGTRATIGSGAYERSINKYSVKANVISKTCPMFVPFIEEGEIKSNALKIVAKNYLKDIKKCKTDTLIMGCTHYPIIRSLIKKELGNVRLIDPGKAVVKEVFAYLIQNGLLNSQTKKGKKEYYVTDLTERFADVAEMFLGEKIKGKLRKVDLTK
jgi:glutamate racemase